MDQVELINGWNLPGWLGPVLAAPAAGSFLGVLIMRLPLGREAWRGIVQGRSHCMACRHVLGARDLVPIASFLMLRGRCRFCGVPISVQHVWIEVSAIVVACWAATTGAQGGMLWASCALGWTLLALGWIDVICLRLPDLLTLPLILAGLGEAAWLEPDALTDRALGSAFGYLGFRLLAWLYRRLRGRDGLGQGDAKLLAAGGAWIGWSMLPAVCLGAALLGLAWALRHGKIDYAARSPFGPFLASAVWGVWLYA